MSLPSEVIFYDKKGSIISKCFVNCGWYYSDDLVPGLLKSLVYPDNWEKLLLYGKTYTKAKVNELL